MTILNDMEHVYAGLRQGRSLIDRHVELRQPVDVKLTKCPGSKKKQIYVRCPTCGGKVILPCLLCSLERWRSC